MHTELHVHECFVFHTNIGMQGIIFQELHCNLPCSFEFDTLLLQYKYILCWVYKELNRMLFKIFVHWLKLLIKFEKEKYSLACIIVVHLDKKKIIICIFISLCDNFKRQYLSSQINYRGNVWLSNMVNILNFCFEWRSSSKLEKW